MNDAEIIQNVPPELFDPSGNAPLTKLLVREGTIVVFPENYKARAGDEIYDYSKNNGSILLKPAEPQQYKSEFTTAEEWLTEQGIGGNRQPTLLYLRQSLAASSKESPLLNALEQYLQTILALFAMDSSPRSDWPVPPTTFEAAVQEAVGLIPNPPQP